MSLLGPIFNISAEVFISIKSNTVSHEFNTIGLSFQLFDIATKSRTQLFPKSLFTFINKTDIKTIDTTLNIMGIDTDHDNEYDYDLSLFRQNLD